MQKYLLGAALALGLCSSAEAAPLTDYEAIALLRGADTRYCRRYTPVHSDADGYERAITHGQSLELQLTPELDRAASFTLVKERNLSRTPADHLVNFDRTYKFTANGEPLEFDYSVQQKVLKRLANGNFKHDSARITGCIFVPDKVTIASKTQAPDGASVTVTYHETMRLSPLALFLNQVWSDGVDSRAVPRDHVAELRRLPNGSWRVEKVDGATLGYRPGETIPRSPVDSTAEQRSQERIAAKLKCALPGRREALHLRVLTPETEAMIGGQAIDPVKNAVAIRDNGGLRLTWDGQPIDRVRLRQYLDLTAHMNPQPWLLIDKADETPLSCEVVKEIIAALRYNAPWFY